MRNLLLMIIMIILLAACSYHTATPPAKLNMLETPQALSSQEIRTGLEVMASMFDIGGSQATLIPLFSKGLGEIGQLTVTPYYSDFYKEDEKLFTSAAGAHAEIKGNISDFNHFAYTYGTGFGYSKYGSMLSVDAGYVIGYENRYFIPFLNHYVFASLPFGTKEIDFDNHSIHKKLTNTIGTVISAGFAVRFFEFADLKIGVHIAAMKSETDNLNSLGANFALELKF